MATIPKKVLERFTKGIKRYQRILESAKKRDVNESDTVVIITDMLSDVFGYDKYSEITQEYVIRHTYCDLAIKIKGSIKFLFEVKAIGLNLKKEYIKQAIDYGTNQGIDWVVLTNGIMWHVYKVKYEKPIDAELVCSIDLLSINIRKKEDQEKLFILCKEGLKKKAIEEFNDYRAIVNRFTIASIILGEEVKKKIIKELKHMKSGSRISNEEVNTILKNEVLKRDVLEGDSAREAFKRYRKISKKRFKKEQTKKIGIHPNLIKPRDRHELK